MKTKARTIRSIGVALGIMMIGFVSLWAQKAPAEVPRLRALITDGMRPAVKNLAPQIERFTGRSLEADLQSEYSITLRDQISQGDVFDVAILTKDLLDDMIKQGRIVADSRVELGRCGMGIAIRAGTTKPDVSTSEAVKRTLLNAKFLSYRAPGITADLSDIVFERLGIVEEMKPKLMLVDRLSRTGAQKKVAEGNGGLVLGLSPEVLGPGVDFVGPLPGDLQSNYIYFVGGVTVNSHDPEKAKELLRFLTTPAAAPALKAVGIELH